MKNLVQCRKLEAKFRQLAVSDPARRLLWLAEADNWQLQHRRSLAFDEQRHQDVASIGKFDRVVMAMWHIWFDHTKLGNAEAGCSRPDPSLVVLNVLLEG